MRLVIFISVFLLLSMPAFAQTGCINGNCSNGNGTYKWENGDMYSGTWSNDTRTGYGRYDWADGSYYVGNFLNGLLEGEGAYYTPSGTEMVGWFTNNEYKGKEKPATSGASNINGGGTAAATITSGTTADSWEKIAADLEKSNQEEEAAKKLALSQAKFYDFPTVANLVIDAFYTNFESLKGPERKGYLDITSSWHSNIYVTGTDDAMVSGGFLTTNNSWYNVLYTGASKSDVTAKYDAFVKEFNEKVKTKCCTLVYDKYDDYVSEEYESYGTYWMPFLTNDGYDGTVFEDILIEIEMTTQVLENGYQVIFRVGHMSDKTSNND